jgi:glycosyltransferase involved in cell wall biosynthesis
VVTTDVAGVKELVVDGQTGFVVPQRDVHGLARAILAVVDDDPLRHRLGQAGRQRVECDFSFTDRLQRLEDLYAQLLNRRASDVSAA